MEPDTASSPEIAILLAIAALAALWTFISKTKMERRGSRLVDWIRQNYREAWAALPWVYRYIFRDRGLAELARRNAISDPDFAREYGKIAPFRRHILISGIIAAGAIALIVIGVRFFGWQF